MARTGARASSDTTTDPVESPLLVLVAAAGAGAGVIHFAMVAPHSGDGLLDPLGFAAFAWFQVGVAVALLAVGFSRRLLAASVLGNAAAAGLWVWSRTAGLPFGSHAGVAEGAAAVDVIAVSLEVTAIAAACWLLFAPRRMPVSQLAAVVLGVSALALATAGIVVPESRSHGAGAHASHGASNDDEDGAAASHDHSTEDHNAGDHSAGDESHVLAMAAIDGERCDWGFNPQAYWDEAATLGVDTYAGGAMAAHDAAGAPTESAASAPLGGRGSEELDRLVSMSMNAASEATAGALVAELSEATDEEYAAWIAWMRANQQDHAHGTAAPGDTGGHGGHLGPHPWEALIDEDECDRLSDELATARDVAMRYPTARDAMDAGWAKVTTYVPGIAAHYMNFGYVDGRFAIEEPEMLLYDGEGPDAHVVGLSYYIMLAGEAEPTQGFTGTSDHYHRHIGLCVAGTLVVGDSTTTEAECSALGGVKQGGSAGWMSHVWVVPGCESPWGVFSGANPLLDAQVSRSSGQDDGGCAASGARGRYDLAPGAPPDGEEPGGGSTDLAEG